MHRFYIPDISKETTLSLDKNYPIFHQLKNVLRIKEWQQISIFNGKENTDYVYQCTHVEKKEIELEQKEEIHKTIPNIPEIILHQSLPKKREKFEWVVEKATELWVSQIYPIQTKRTEISELKRSDRLTHIAIEASEQSERNTVPEIHSQVEVIDRNYNFPKQSIVFYGRDIHQTWKQVRSQLDMSTPIHIFIGPEWGWDPEEIEWIKDNKNVQICLLGSTILRTETAAISSISSLLY